MSMDCPILVWMLSLNREYTKEVRVGKVSFPTITVQLIMNKRKEYDECYNLVRECVHHVRFQYNPPDPDSFRE